MRHTSTTTSSTVKPFGYVLRSKVEHKLTNGTTMKSPYPWMNSRWSDAINSCGTFRRYIGDAQVWKRLSSVQGYDLEIVPVYGDPRKMGDEALSIEGVARNEARQEAARTRMAARAFRTDLGLE